MFGKQQYMYRIVKKPHLRILANDITRVESQNTYNKTLPDGTHIIIGWFDNEQAALNWVNEEKK